jgi:hypothetical protein
MNPKKRPPQHKIVYYQNHQGYYGLRLTGEWLPSRG